MKRLSRYFIRGLITVLPLGLTVYLLYLFLSWSEQLALQVMRPFIGDFYVPGLGLLLGVVGIVVLGVVVSQPWLGRLLSLIELPFTNLPVVKSIYSSLKNFDTGSSWNVISARVRCRAGRTLVGALRRRRRSCTDR